MGIVLQLGWSSQRVWEYSVCCGGGGDTWLPWQPERAGWRSRERRAWLLLGGLVRVQLWHAIYTRTPSPFPPRGLRRPQGKSIMGKKKKRGVDATQLNAQIKVEKQHAKCICCFRGRHKTLTFRDAGRGKHFVFSRKRDVMQVDRVRLKNQPNLKK